MYQAAEEGQAFVSFLAGLPARYAAPAPAGPEQQIAHYLATVPLWPNQFVYIHDLRTGQFHHKGFDGCLGYALDALTADFFVRNIHPADRSLYFKVSKALLSFVLHHSAHLGPFVTMFQINYRVRRHDGSYITVLRQSTPFLKNANNEVEAYLSFCTDISLLAPPAQIKWSLQGPQSETFPQFFAEAAAPQRPVLSEREQQVLRLLGRGLTSPAISQALFISLNTVNTHRKNLMRKAGTKKTVNLLAFGRDHGYL